MKKIILLAACAVLLLVGTSFLPAQQRTASANDDYVLVFSDEFNLPNGSQPNSEYWSRANRNKSDWAHWISSSKDVVYIKNGCLVCVAKPNRSEKADTARILTGAIWSKHKYSFQYGKLEVRMKTNAHQGNFPAVWMGREVADGTSVPYGEIDVVETFGTKRQSSHAAHTQYTQDNANHGQKRIFTKSVDVTKWHVYGMEWTPQSITWTVDGEVVGTYNKPTDKKLLTQNAWTFDNPFFILMNQSVGNGHHGLKPDYNYTYKTQFDWIRVYQKK